MSSVFLPKQLNYRTLPETIDGITTNRFKIASQQSSVPLSTGNVLQYRIPCGIHKGMMLDTKQSYLEFNVTSTGYTYQFSSNVGSIIRQVEITSPDGAVIESLSGFPQFNVMYDDMTVDYSSGQSNESILNGGCVNASYNNNAREGAIIPADQALTLCLNLHSIVGDFSHSYLPIGLMANGDLIITLYLNSITTAGIMGDASHTTLTINNSYYNAHIVNVPNPAIDNIISTKSVNGKLYIPIVGFENIPATLASGTTSAQINLPFKKSSLKAIYGIARNSVLVNASGTFSNTCRNTLKNSSYYYTVDGIEVPSGRIAGTRVDGTTGYYAPAYAELLRTTHLLPSGRDGTRMTFLNFGLDDTGSTATKTNGTASQCGSFIFSVDLSRHSGAHLQTNNGINTLNSNITFNLACTATSAINNLDFYGFYDGILEIDLATGVVNKLS